MERNIKTVYNDFLMGLMLNILRESPQRLIGQLGSCISTRLGMSLTKLGPLFISSKGLKLKRGLKF